MNGFLYTRLITVYKKSCVLKSIKIYLYIKMTLYYLKKKNDC